MTLSSTVVRSEFTSTNSSGPFATDFVFWNSSELKTVLVSSEGTETTWTEGSEYDVTGGSGATGNVLIASTSNYLETDQILLVLSNILDLQETDLPSGGVFPSSQVEEELDRTVRRIQQKEEIFSRIPTLSAGSTFASSSGITLPDPSDNGLLAWSSSDNSVLKNLTANSSEFLSSPVAVDEGGTAATTAAAALTNLGGAGSTTTNTFTNKTFDANATGNSLSNVDVADLAPGTDGQLITWGSTGGPDVVAVGSSGNPLVSNGTGAAPTFRGLPVSGLAAGTDGELLTWGSTGGPTVVAVGSSGHVLTSNGAGAAPTFQAAAAGGAWTLISDNSPSAVASLSLTGFDSSAYDAYCAVISNLRPATDSRKFYARTSTNGGAAYDSTGYQFHLEAFQSGDYDRGHSATSASQISLSPSGEKIGNATTEGISGVFWLYGPHMAARYTTMSWSGVMVGDTAEMTALWGTGMRETAADVDGLQFLFDSGNIADGDVQWFGIKYS